MEATNPIQIGTALVGLLLWVRYNLGAGRRATGGGPYHQRLICAWVNANRYICLTPDKDLYDEEFDCSDFAHVVYGGRLEGNKLPYIPAELKVFGVHHFSELSAEEVAEAMKLGGQQVKTLRRLAGLKRRDELTEPDFVPDTLAEVGACELVDGSGDEWSEDESADVQPKILSAKLAMKSASPKAPAKVKLLSVDPKVSAAIAEGGLQQAQGFSPLPAPARPPGGPPSVAPAELLDQVDDLEQVQLGLPSGVGHKTGDDTPRGRFADA